MIVLLYIEQYYNNSLGYTYIQVFSLLTMTPSIQPYSICLLCTVIISSLFYVITGFTINNQILIELIISKHILQLTNHKVNRLSSQEQVR